MPELGEIRKNEWGAKIIWVACERCGKERWVGVIKGQLRSMRCRSCGPGAPVLPGTQYTTAKGYVWIKLSPNDPYYSMASKAARVPEHRYIMANVIGRSLKSWEYVHHLNGIKDDNLPKVNDQPIFSPDGGVQIGNLALMPSKKHGIGHAQLNKALQARIRELEEKVEVLAKGEDDETGQGGILGDGRDGGTGCHGSVGVVGQ